MSENIEYGFSSPLWLAKAVVGGADCELVRYAALDVMNYMWTADVINPDEIYDRLVQISTNGFYAPAEFTQEEYEEAARIADEIIERDIDEQVQKFREQLDNLGGEDDDNSR